VNSELDTANRHAREATLALAWINDLFLTTPPICGRAQYSERLTLKKLYRQY